MPVKKRPSLRALWLGQQLKELRDGIGMNLKEVGAYLQRDASTVSRFESGEYPARRVDVAALLDLYRVDDEEKRERLKELGEAVWQTGWWDEYSKDVKGEMVDLAWLEERTKQIRGYVAIVVHSLLQIPEYAEAVIRSDDEEWREEQIRRFLSLRLNRQKVLEKEHPPELFIIMDDSVLFRPFGGRDVLRRQLEHLVELAARPHVEIRVLPRQSGTFAGDSGMFTLFSMPEPYPDAAYTETLAGGIYVESEKTERFVRAYDRLLAVTLSADESAAFIARVAKEV
jgi:transcriptional regulator with XRE-family HTH domain